MQDIKIIRGWTASGMERKIKRFVALGYVLNGAVQYAPLNGRTLRRPLMATMVQPHPIG